ncbi:Uncharacterised protein [uncultured archaeon]|nr:Uncharacterised protein [uncultured archaeon]
MWTLIWVVFALYFSYLIYRTLDNLRPEKRIENLENSARALKTSALRDDLRHGKEQEQYVLDETEGDYLHLKEKYRHDQKQRLQLALDWYEYTSAIHTISCAIDSLMVDVDFELVKEEVKEPHVKRHEIERRFQEMRGAKFVDRWNQWSSEHPSPSLNDLPKHVGSANEVQFETSNEGKPLGHEQLKPCTTSDTRLLLLAISAVPFVIGAIIAAAIPGKKDWCIGLGVTISAALLILSTWLAPRIEAKKSRAGKKR